MSLLETTGLSVRYGGRVVLEGVDFSIERGEIVTIVGPNGSGKSTFLKSIVGAVKPSSGGATRKSGLRVGYAPQRLDIDPTLPITVRRLLSLPARISAADAEQALAQVGAPGIADQQLSALSGGQFQRALLARALLGKPELLILDEPTQGLDQPGSAALYQLIETLRRELGCAVLMVSHDLHVVMSASDRVICLNGHVCCEGTPEIVASAPAYRSLFGTGTKGALALYRHAHDHSHDAHEHV